MPKLATTLEKRLAAYATAAGVALTVAPSTSAQIVYTDIEPDVCLSIATHFIDLDADGVDDFRIAHGSSFAPLNSGGACHTFTCYGDVEGGYVDNRFMAFASGRFAQDLSSGATISSGQNFENPSNTYYALFSFGVGPWHGGNDAFVGLRFVADRAGAATTHYGWVRVSAPEDVNSVCIHDFAYESTPDAPIAAGDRGADTAITCTPVGPPIVIPAGGGSFAFDIEIVNNGASEETFDAWIDIAGPGVGRTRGPITRTLPAGASLSRTVNQNIPGGAPAGEYTYTCNVGAFPDPHSSSSFGFEKSAAFAPGDVRVADWSTESDLSAALASEATIEVVGTHQLSNAYPNPFNPTSQFTLAVARNQRVTAALYNVLGQRVASLFDGAVEANASQIIQIDGSALASGAYVVRITGETFSDVLRVTLTK